MSEFDSTIFASFLRGEDEDNTVDDGPPSVKFRRSRNGCAVCKQLKVKCDEKKPKCTRCWTKRKTCVYGEASGSTSPSIGSVSVIGIGHKRKESTSTVGRTEHDAVEKRPKGDDYPIIDLSRSLLMNRRAGKTPFRVDNNKPAPVTQTMALLGVMDNLVASLQPSTPLFEFGPSDWESLEIDNTSGDRASNLLVQNVPYELTPATWNSDFAKAFPSQLARQLFYFYVATTSRILITMGTHGQNPFLSLTSSVGFFDTSSPENCALRMGMLATSANHYVYMIRSTEKWPPGREPPVLAVLERIGKKFKMAALSNLTIAASDVPNVNDDILLATCLTLINRDVMSADTTCQENLDFAIALINKRGGPQKMLEQTRSSITRFLLESLATHEVFGTFTTGKEPILLNSWTPWWFESIETSKTSWEWESVERQFGFSRPTVDLVARIATLFSRKRRLGVSLKTDPLWSQRRKEMSGVTDHLVREATLFLTELDIWGNSLRCLPQHPRVNCGDQIYRYVMKIHVLADILEVPKEDTRITTSVASVLELLSEASCMSLVVMLVWPLLIAGAFCDFSQRDYVRSLFRAFEPHYCSDLETARIILYKQWDNIDRGIGFRPWQEVMRGLGREVLLI